MVEARDGSGEDISLLSLGTTLLQNRWRIVRWALIGGALAAIVVFTTPPSYLASASFVPQGMDQNRSGLASLAGQLGVSLPQGDQSLSPDFYAKLVRSRVILLPIVRKAVVLPDKQPAGRRIPFLDLLEIPEGPVQRREQQGLARLQQMIFVSVSKITAVVELTATTEWPAVSLSIVTDLLDGVNQFNQRTRQSQATAERKFVEGRLAVAASELRAAEDRLEGFLRTNKELTSSPGLMIERDRLQRAVMLQQQVFTSLTQSYEDVRIREVRDTPVITVVETPFVAAVPQPRRRVLHLLIGMILGGLAGTFLAIAAAAMADRRKAGSVEFEEFAGTLEEVKGEMLQPVRFLKRRRRT